MVSVLLALAFATQDKTVDRSAEPALRALFASAGTLRDVHVVINNYSAATGDWYAFNRTRDLYLGSPGQFRLETMSNMGDAALSVCDGTSIMTDPLSDDDTIFLRKIEKPLENLAGQETLALFFQGADAFDKVVVKDQPVVFVTSAPGEKSIECRATGIGKLVVSYVDSPNTVLPNRLDLFRSQRRRDDGTEQPMATSKEYIRLASVGKLSPSLFSVVAPKGKKFEDQRNKSGS